MVLMRWCLVVLVWCRDRCRRVASLLNRLRNSLMFRRHLVSTWLLTVLRCLSTWWLLGLLLSYEASVLVIEPSSRCVGRLVWAKKDWLLSVRCISGIRRCASIRLAVGLGCRLRRNALRKVLTRLSILLLLVCRVGCEFRGSACESRLSTVRWTRLMSRGMWCLLMSRVGPGTDRRRESMARRLVGLILIIGTVGLIGVVWLLCNVLRVVCSVLKCVLLLVAYVGLMLLLVLRLLGAVVIVGGVALVLIIGVGDGVLALGDGDDGVWALWWCMLRLMKRGNMLRWISTLPTVLRKLLLFRSNIWLQMCSSARTVGGPRCSLVTVLVRYRPSVSGFIGICPGVSGGYVYSIVK